MASPILYPLINGKRQDGNSIEANFAGQIYKGFDSIDYSYKKTRSLIRGSHPDPLAKTIGTNEYMGSAELYLAEFNHWMQNVLVPLANAEGLAITGSGLAQVVFTITVNYVSPGMDLITDILYGCTLDGIDAANKVGNEGLKRKVELNPLNISFGGQYLESLQLLPDPGM